VTGAPAIGGSHATHTWQTGAGGGIGASQIGTRGEGRVQAKPAGARQTTGSTHQEKRVIRHPRLYGSRRTHSWLAHQSEQHCVSRVHDWPSQREHSSPFATVAFEFVAPHAAMTTTNVSNNIRIICFLDFLPPTRLLND
jgi:hypothetical protein